MKRRLLMGMFALGLFLAQSRGVFAQESVTLTTYYPAPFGVYRTIRLFPITPAPACTAALAGTMYFFSTTQTLFICTSSMGWQPIGGAGGLWSSNGANIFNVNTGNVGIGTNAPSGRLHIASGNANYVFTGTPASGYTTTFTMDDTGLKIGHNTSIRDIQLRTNNTTRMTILGNGRVGINTINPANALEINSLSTTWGGWNEAIRFTSGAHAAITLPNAGGLLFGMHGNRNFYWADTLEGAYIMNLDATPVGQGRLCVNCTGPGQVLDVNGNISVRAGGSVIAPSMCLPNASNCRSAWPTLQRCVATANLVAGAATASCASCAGGAAAGWVATGGGFRDTGVLDGDQDQSYPVGITDWVCVDDAGGTGVCYVVCMRMT